MNAPEKSFTYLFGPVPSRRFGRSLGVDLTPYKTCSFNCVFCQLGPTPKTTIERKEYVPTDIVIKELNKWIHADGDADFITLAGSGEPTLHTRFGDILQHIHTQTSIRTALLTNGSLLSQPAVREAAKQADVVKISLSVWDQLSLEHINRPEHSISFNSLIQGIKTFREQYRGDIWLEVFIVNGMNCTAADINKLAELGKDIYPDRIQLNTAVRPPAETFVSPVNAEQLERIRTNFTPTADVLAEFDTHSDHTIQANEKTILGMLERRPCTAKQISNVFGLHMNETAKFLGKLERTGHIHAEYQSRQLYYTAQPTPDQSGK